MRTSFAFVLLVVFVFFQGAFAATTTEPHVESEETPEQEQQRIKTNTTLEASEPQAITLQATSANLIPNPDLETAGPASWHKGGYGNNTRTLTYPVTGKSGTGIRVSVSNYVSGDAKWYHNPVPVTGGDTYEFSNSYQSNAESIVTVWFILSNGSSVYTDVRVLPPSASFTSASATFVAPASAVSATIFHLLKSNGTLTTDDYSLVNVSGAGNPITNPGFEFGGTSPDGWIRGRWGTHDATYTYPTAGNGSARAAQVTMANRVSGDAKWAFTPVPLASGSYVYTDDYQATVPTILTVQFRHNNGSITYKDIATLPPSSSWRIAYAEFSVPTGVTGVTVFHLINRNGTLTIDNAAIHSDAVSVFSTGAVTLRLDDGWKNQYDNALPILTRTNLKGTFYIASRQIAPSFPGYMSRAQVEQVFSLGHEIGAHTRTHADLASLSYDGQYAEIKGSRDDLTSWNAGEIRSFAYPFGSYNADTIKAVKAAGFESAASSNGGEVTPASDPYQLERRSLETSTTWPTLKGWVDAAVANKRWLVLSAHQIEDPCPDRYCITPSLLSQLADYLVANNVRVITTSEAIDSI